MVRPLSRRLEGGLYRAGETPGKGKGRKRGRPSCEECRLVLAEVGEDLGVLRVGQRLVTALGVFLRDDAGARVAPDGQVGAVERRRVHLHAEVRAEYLPQYLDLDAHAVRLVEVLQRQLLDAG